MNEVDADDRRVERHDEEELDVRAVAETDRQRRACYEHLFDVEVAVEEDDTIVPGVGNEDVAADLGCRCAEERRGELMRQQFLRINEYA